MRAVSDDDEIYKAACSVFLYGRATLRIQQITDEAIYMVTESISDDTLMGSVDVSLEDLNRSIELLRERGYDITITYAKDDETKLRVFIERAPGQLLISHGLPVVEGDVKLYFGAS